MNMIGTNVLGTACVLAAALLAGMATRALGADANFSLPAPATQPAAVKYSPPSHKNILGTTFVDWDALPVRVQPAGFGRAVFDNPTSTLDKFEMHISTLRPGMISHPVHQHAWEEILLVKEGEVEVSQNGQLKRCGPGALIFYASHDPHNIKNPDDKKDATYYVMNFVTDRVHTVSEKPALEQAIPGMLGSTIFDADSMTPTPTAIGSTLTVVNSPSITFKTFGFHVTTLNAGASTKTDIVDPGDELFIIKTGILEVTVNGVSHRMKEGSFFYCAPNDKRTLKNLGTTPAVYQVLKIVSDKTPAAAG